MSVFCHLSSFLVSFSSHFLCQNMVSKKPFRLPLSSRFQSNSLIIPSNSHLWSRLQTRLNYWVWCQIDAKLRCKSWLFGRHQCISFFFFLCFMNSSFIIDDDSFFRFWNNATTTLLFKNLSCHLWQNMDILVPMTSVSYSVLNCQP